MGREETNRRFLERMKSIDTILIGLGILAALFWIGFTVGAEAHQCPEINTTTDNFTCEPVILYQYIYTFPDSQLPEIKCEVCKCQS